MTTISLYKSRGGPAFLLATNFRPLEYLAGLSKLVSHVVTTRNRASKQYLVAVFIEPDGKDLLVLEINTFKATFIFFGDQCLK